MAASGGLGGACNPGLQRRLRSGAYLLGASLLPYPNPKQGVEQWLEPLLSASTTAHRGLLRLVFGTGLLVGDLGDLAHDRSCFFSCCGLGLLRSRHADRILALPEALPHVCRTVAYEGANRAS